MGKNKNLPAINNSLTQIIRGVMPNPTPKPSFDQDPLSLIFYNWKISKLVEAHHGAADIAETSRRQLTATLGNYEEVMLFELRVQDGREIIKHGHKMRKLAKREKLGDIRLKEAEIEQTNYKTALIAQEVEMAKIETQIKIKQLKEILAEDKGG